MSQYASNTAVSAGKSRGPMTEDEIKEINDNSPYDQGIYTEPWGIPITAKEPVVYARFETGGYRGGNCWGSEAGPFKFVALDLVLGKLCPQLTYLQYRQVESLLKDNRDTTQEYYGNSTDYLVQYIPLSELQEFVLGLPQVQ